jgi:hypothetical protein
MKYDPRACYARPFAVPKQNCEMPAQAHRDILANFKAIADALRESHPRVKYFDQNVLFCDDELCRFKLPTLPAFRDEYDHLSEFASTQLMRHFVEWARVNAPDILGSGAAGTDKR